MRRFYDRKDPDFGYDRVVRPKARRHQGPTANFNPSLENERLLKIQKDHAGDVGWIGRDYRWHPGDYREVFVPEDEEEKRVLASLDKMPQTLLFTMGLFDDSGRARRIHGPAYLKYEGELAKEFHWLNESDREDKGMMLLKRASKRLLEEREVYLDGWKLVGHKVFADKEDCLNCHNDRKQVMDFEGRSRPIRKSTLR